jgi:hypothetical protein
VRDFLQSLLGWGSVWSIANLMRRISTIIEVHFSEPSWMIRLVAIAVVAQQLWWKWRGTGDYKAVSYAVDATRFTIATLLLTITGVVSVPAMAWYGVALYFWLAID